MADPQVGDRVVGRVPGWLPGETFAGVVMKNFRSGVGHHHIDVRHEDGRWYGFCDKVGFVFIEINGREHMKFTITIDVDVERDSGKFAPKDEIAEALQEAVEGADPGTISGVGADSDSEYSTTEWNVEVH